MKIEIEPEIADHVLPLVRGLKLSRDLDLAEQAIRAEREILKARDENNVQEGQKDKESAE
jgi:hypothetical protein